MSCGRTRTPALPSALQLIASIIHSIAWPDDSDLLMRTIKNAPPHMATVCKRDNQTSKAFSNKKIISIVIKLITGSCWGTWQIRGRGPLHRYSFFCISHHCFLFVTSHLSHLHKSKSWITRHNLSYFSFILPRKTCWGELASVYSQQVFKENLLKRTC